MNRPLPSNPEAESALLGAILINNDAFARVAPFLEAEHFFEPVHGRIYAFMASLIQQGRVASPVTMKTFLPLDMAIGDFTPLEYLAHLCADATTIANAEDYGRVVRDMAAKRALIEVAEDVLNLAFDGPVEMTASKILDDTEGRLGELRGSHRLGGLSLSLGSALDESSDRIARAYQDRRPSGWGWGLSEFEQVLDGKIEAGNNYGIVAASGEGKTTAVIQVGRALAEQGIPVLFLSGEQTVQQCIDQMHQQRLSITSKDIKEGKLSEEEYVRLLDDKKLLRGLPFSIQQWSDLKVGQIGLRVRSFFKRWGPGVFAIDHVKKIVPDHPNDILAQQVFQVYAGLKDIATATGGAGLILMQRNSDFLNRPVARPVRRDVYGGEGGLQNLDACVALFRPEKWLKEKHLLAERDQERDALAIKIEQVRGVAELYGLKTRFGEEGRMARLRFEPRYTRFVSLPKQRAEEAPEMEF